MKTIQTTILAAMVGGLFACSSTSTTDGGTTSGGTTTGGSSTGSTTGATSTGGTTTGGTTTGGTTTGGTTTGGATTGGTTTGGTTGFPAVPTLGAEIDRMGRPAVNTALTAPFGFFPLPDGGSITEPAAKDLYNADGNPAGWVQNYTLAFAGNLAIYDSLDTVCGNQAAASPAYSDGGIPPTRYQLLGSVLASDQLWIDTAVGSCGQYLAVELEALGAIPPGTDCGGRTPLEDTIDTTYSLLAIGLPAGVTDGISMDGDGVASLTTFPFLANPN